MCQGKQQVYFACGCWAPIAYTQCQASIDRVTNGGEQLRYEDCDDYKLMDQKTTGYHYDILEGHCEKCRKEATKNREREAKLRQKAKAKEEKKDAAAKRKAAKKAGKIHQAIKNIFKTKEQPKTDDHADGVVARPSMWFADPQRTHSW